MSNPSIPDQTGPAWTYQPPLRPAGYSDQCYYRTSGVGHGYTISVPGASKNAPHLTVFRFAPSTSADIKIEFDTAAITVTLDAASLRALHAALGDALHDIEKLKLLRLRRESFERIAEQMREDDENGGSHAYYVHPDIFYVPADQVEAKVAELKADGREQFMVLADAASEVAA